MQNENVRILPAGDSAIVVEFGVKIDMTVNAQVQALRAKIEASPFIGFREVIPTYRSLAVCFDPVRTDVQGVEQMLGNFIASLDATSSEGGTLITIPTCYDGEYAPDMENVVQHTKLSKNEVIARHSGINCYCYMLGFTPGFAYLGGMDKSIATPRLKEPREAIPAGSVGIAGEQTGIYPIASPGGWQLIGRTPLRMFDPDRKPPIFLKAGMWVRFKPITVEEFAEIEKQVKAGVWQPDRECGGSLLSELKAVKH